MRPHLRSLQALPRAATIAAILATLTVLPLAAEPAGAAMTYVNRKFGFSLAVPSDVFVPAASRNPDDGGLWESRDGQARLLAVAGANTSGESVSSYRSFVLQETYKGAILEYAPIRDTWFVLSGRLDDRMFYERINFACDGRYIYGWQISYPAAERQRYDRIVEQVHRSYRAGRGEDGRCGRVSRDPT